MDDCASHESFIAQDYPVRDRGAYQLTEPPIPKNSKSLDDLVDPFCSGPPGSVRSHDVSVPRAPRLEKSPPLRPNRRKEADVELGTRGASRRSVPDPQSGILIHHWKSPIGKTISLSTSFLFRILMFRSPRIWISR